MKVKRMGITEILRRIWLFPANTIKSSESFSKQPTQPIVELNSSFGHIIVTFIFSNLYFKAKFFSVNNVQIIVPIIFKVTKLKKFFESTYYIKKHILMIVYVVAKV